jgi:glycosyltransferase involved in cell wall biosynthesis
MRVLWLASWYPDEYEPTNGDFIQRHAKAVSQLIPVDLIHVAQAGKDFGHVSKTVITDNGSLNEAIHYFPFKKTGNAIIDKISYNKIYLEYYKKIIRSYINEKGRPDLVHVHVPMKAGLIAMRLSKESGIPYIISEHSSLYLEIAEDNFYKRSFYFRHNTKKIFQQAALVTNVSGAIAVVLKQLFRLKEVQVIPNVVDTDHFCFKPKEKAKVFRWLHVSTMLPLKNVDKIIQIFASIAKQRDDWELILAGPVNAELKKLAADIGLGSKIKFTGEVSYEQVALEMQQCDGFILFSKHENFPCVIIEALCCGLPVVSSNVGGIAEAVNDSNGILVDPGDTSALKSSVISIMDKSFKYDPAMIAADAVSKYNYQTIANKFIAAYNKLLTR